MKYLLFFCLVMGSLPVIHAADRADTTGKATVIQNAITRYMIPRINDGIPPLSGADVEFDTPDGEKAHAWVSKAATKSNHTLLVFHESWGLTDFPKQEAEKLGKALGINVLVIDLFDRKVATTREQGTKLVQGVDIDRASAIIEGAFAFIGPQQKVFTLGWDYGGAWSLQAAIIGGSQVAGCIMYYGAPEKEIRKLQLLQCDVIGFFATLDKYPSPAQATEFKENMETAGKILHVNHYPVNHGFANPDNPAYDKTSAIDAYIKTLNFIQGKKKIK